MADSSRCETVDGALGSDGARERSRRPLLVVFALAALFGLFAAISAPIAPLFDPDEGYYPATAAETMRSGPFWDLRFNEAPRWDKPILSYALIQSAFWLVGETVTAARLPSALESAVLIAVVGAVVAQLGGGRAGVLCALVIGSTLGVGIFSRAAHPEIALVASVVTTELLLCVRLAVTDRGAQRKAAIGCGIAMGLGVLAKGPVAVVLPILTLCGLLVLGQFRRELKPLGWDLVLCVSIAALLAAPWYAVMTAQHGFAFLYEALWRQNVGRYTTARYGHSSGALSLWLPAIVGLFPWLALLPQALRALRVRPDGPRELLRTGMCVAALSSLVFYSISTSKLPSYAFMAVPSLAIVVGLWIDEAFDHVQELRVAWVRCAALLGGLGLMLLSTRLWIAAVVQPQQLFGGNRPPGSDTGALLAPLTAPIGCLLVVGALSLAISRRAWWRTATVAVIGSFVPVVALVAAAPTLREMYPWETIAGSVDVRYGPVWLVGRRAPSLSFYTRGPVHSVASAEALQHVVQHQPHCWLVVTTDEWPHLAENLSHVEGSVVAQQGRMMLIRLAPSP